MFVAVVYTKSSKRHDGSLACFVGERRGPVVTKAFAARREYVKNGYGSFDILVGKLDEQLEVSADGNFLVSDSRRLKHLLTVEKPVKRRIRK